MSNAYRIGAVCAVAAIAAAGVWLGLRPQTDTAREAQTTAPAQAAGATARIPDFMQSDRTSWYPDRDDGDNWLQPLGGGPGPIVSRPDHPYRPNGGAEVGGDDAAGDPTYRIADLTNPILQPAVMARMKRDNDEVLAGKIPFMARERCYPPGPAWNIFRRVGTPMVIFVQQPKFVLMIYRGDNQIRHVYLDVPHSANPKPSWNGEAVGHYEGGDTLVVDTIGYLAHPYSFVDNYRTPHSSQLHTVERYRLSPDGKAIDVTVHFEDPETFTMPWDARQHYVVSTRGPLEETICADSAGRGTDIFNYGASHAKDLVPFPEEKTPAF